MYFINRSKLEEPCPFIVACYNLGDRKDHDLELAMHTVSKHSVRKQLTHFSIWTLAMPLPHRRRRRRGLTACALSRFFFCVGVLCLAAAVVSPFVLAIYVMRVHTVLFSCIMTISFIPIYVALSM